MTYQLTIEPLGETIEVEEGQTVLDAALRAGVWLPHACCHGLCATCKVQVTDGEVEHGEASPFALMDFEREEGRALACCATLASDAVIEADLEEEPDAENHPLADYEGTVTGLVDLTPTVKGLFIELDGEGMAFQAGQYVNLHLPGLDQPRAFSLANPPSERKRLELNVRLVPGGEATTHIHHRLKPGDRVRVTGPFGRFFVRASAPEPLLFLAGGTGLSSPKSMILDRLARGDTRPITLVYGARNRAELYYDGLFREIALAHPNFTYLPVLSQAGLEDRWEGLRGHVDEAAKSHFGNDFRGHKAYVCGPPAMIDACITTLMLGRLFERDIHMERFLSAADAAQQSQRSPLFRAL
jgi:phenol hydroxylase P5 protein